MSARAILAGSVVPLLLALSACGGAGPQAEGTGVASGSRPTVGMRELERSVERETTPFLEREGSALRVSLHRFLGPELTTEVERGSAVCRPGSETAAIVDPEKYPFACIVSADADGQGLQVGITLGFVGTEVKGRCWRAANDRVSVTTTAPVLLGRREAMRPVNQIAGCVS